MEDLKQYLSRPAQLRLYSEGLELFRRYALQEFSQHFKDLQLGPLGNNPQTLLECLQAVASSGVVEPVFKVPVIKTVLPSAEIRAPKTLPEVELMLQLRRLRQKRSSTAQQFHECQDDQERALICDALDAITAQIRKKQEEITHVQRFGVEKPAPQIRPKKLPKTENELQKLQNYTSSNILKVERRIDDLLALPENNRKRRQYLSKREERLQELTSLRLEIRKALRDLRNEKKQKDG
jgi:hypothetical protein